MSSFFGRQLYLFGEKEGCINPSADGSIVWKRLKTVRKKGGGIYVKAS